MYRYLGIYLLNNVNTFRDCLLLKESPGAYILFVFTFHVHLHIVVSTVVAAVAVTSAAASSAQSTVGGLRPTTNTYISHVTYLQHTSVFTHRRRHTSHTHTHVLNNDHQHPVPARKPDIKKPPKRITKNKNNIVIIIIVMI